MLKIARSSLLSIKWEQSTAISIAREGYWRGSSQRNERAEDGPVLERAEEAWN